MKILITSSGFDKDIVEKLDSITRKKRADISICVVVNAKKYRPEEIFQKTIQNHQTALKELGYSKIKIVDLDNFVGNDINCDIMYFIGGNSFYLLDSIRRNKFSEVISKFLGEGKIVVGQSAGSYIMCPNIRMAHWKHQDRDIIGMKDLDALNLVPFLVTVHYDESFDDAIKKGVKDSKMDTYALKDGQAIYVDGEKMDFINGQPLFFKAK